MRHDVAPETTLLPSEEQAAVHEHLRSDREKLTAILDRQRESSNVVPITGRDGKTYPKPPPRPPEQKKPRRGPITESFWRATLDLGTLASRIERLAADDRFARNRNEIAFSNRSNLKRAHDKIAAVLAQLEQVDQTDLLDGGAS